MVCPHSRQSLAAVYAVTLRCAPDFTGAITWLGFTVQGTGAGVNVGSDYTAI